MQTYRTVGIITLGAFALAGCIASTDLGNTYTHSATCPDGRTVQWSHVGGEDDLFHARQSKIACGLDPDAEVETVPNPLPAENALDLGEPRTAAAAAAVAAGVLIAIVASDDDDDEGGAGTTTTTGTR